MTKEEILEQLKHDRDLCNFNPSTGESEPIDEDCRKSAEALDYAIKALEQQPSEDCVDRNHIIATISHHHFDKDKDNFDLLVHNLCKEVKALSPVTPTRKVGEWCKQNDDYFDWYECSECGYGGEGEMQYSSEYDVRTKYCPNCGAEMRGKEE
jgi:hypothetical protein